MSDVLEHADAGEVTEAPLVNDAAVDREAGEPSAERSEPPSASLDDIAAELGWAPKEKWRGDESKWVDAATFLRNNGNIIKSLRRDNEHLTKAAHTAIEAQRKKIMAEAEERIRQATQAGDEDAVIQAVQDRDRAAQAPDPGYLAFTARNAWFGQSGDYAATQLALVTAQKIADKGGSPSEQYAEAEKEVRKRFPELFGDEAEPEPTQRKAPTVEGGQRTSAGAPRKRGWAEMPARDRPSPKILSDFKMTQAEWAETYWSEKDQEAAR